VGGEYTVVAMSVLPGRWDPRGDAVYSLQRRADAFGSPIGAGRGAVVDQALGIDRLQSVGGEGRTGAVAQQALKPGSVVSLDAYTGIPGEAAALVPLRDRLPIFFLLAPSLGLAPFPGGWRENPLSADFSSSPRRTNARTRRRRSWVCTASASSASRAFTSMNRTPCSASGSKTPSMTPTGQWVCSFSDEPNRWMKATAPVRALGPAP
jgi:hypothetical protein